MSKTRALLLSFLLTLTLVSTGCFDEFGGAYDGEDKIAFSADLVASSQANDEPAQVAEASADTAVEFETELIGPQRSDPTEVSYSVVEETVWYTKEVPTDTGSGEPRIDSTLLARPTTAEEGTHYTIPGTYTLPESTSTAGLPVNLLDGLSPGDAPVRLTLQIDGNEEQNLLPAEQLRYLEVIIQP